MNRVAFLILTVLLTPSCGLVVSSLDAYYRNVNRLQRYIHVEDDLMLNHVEQQKLFPATIDLEYRWNGKLYEQEEVFRQRYQLGKHKRDAMIACGFDRNNVKDLSRLNTYYSGIPRGKVVEFLECMKSKGYRTSGWRIGTHRSAKYW